MVEIHDLHVRFHGASREAVAGIDLTIRDGEVVGLVGAISYACPARSCAPSRAASSALSFRSR